MEEVNQGVVFLCSAGEAMVSHFEQQGLLSLSSVPGRESDVCSSSLKESLLEDFPTCPPCV